MEPFKTRCEVCDGPPAGYVDGIALCEGHWYERANAAAEVEELQRRAEILALENAEMDRHFAEHPHG